MECKLKWFTILLLLLLRGSSAHGFIGMLWGRFATQSMVPSMVVDLLLQNGIRDIRLFAPSPNVLLALDDSPIGISVTLTNDFIKSYKYSNLKNVSDWVRELIAVPLNKKHYHINITTLVILDEPYSTYGGRVPVMNATNVFNDTLNSLKFYNLTHIRTTTAHLTDILKNVSKPSEADFRDDLKENMHDYLRLFNQSNSFFTYNIYPIFSAQSNNWPIEFSFMDNKSNFSIIDGKYTYTNAFEFMYDALVVAIEKAGYPDMEIVVGQIGWPTDGAQNATAENAERFYRGFLNHIVDKKGTPRRPNKNIDVFLSALTDENKVPLEMGPYQRRRGIYNYDGKPKYRIDFSGQGRDIYPSEIKGIPKMPSRWCKFNGKTKNITKVDEQMKYACSKADCSSLSPGATCGNLDYEKHVSYAFNIFYQTKNQDTEKDHACDFEGFGELTPYDPSVGTCIFPVEILTAEVVDGGTQTGFYIGYSNINGGPHICYTTTPHFSIALPLLVTLFVFIRYILLFM